MAHFKSFKHDERLNGDSRIYLGVRWQFDADDGIKAGNAVAKETFQRFVRRPSK